jgi:hypothetical protein
MSSVQSRENVSTKQGFERIATRARRFRTPLCSTNPPPMQRICNCRTLADAREPRDEPKRSKGKGGAIPVIAQLKLLLDHWEGCAKPPTCDVAAHSCRDRSICLGDSAGQNFLNITIGSSCSGSIGFGPRFGTAAFSAQTGRLRSRL